MEQCLDAEEEEEGIQMAKKAAFLMPEKSGGKWSHWMEQTEL